MSDKILGFFFLYDENMVQKSIKPSVLHSIDFKNAEILFRYVTTGSYWTR